MFAVRDNQCRVVRRCRTEAEARVFVRSAKGRTAWVEDTNGAFVPVPGATRQPRFNV